MLSRVGPSKLASRHASLVRAVVAPTSRAVHASASAHHFSRQLRPSKIASRSAARLPALSQPFSTSSISRQAEVVEDDAAFDLSAVERVSDEVDVCIVGGGPAGLSAAIRIMQNAEKEGKEIRVVVLEKGAEIGQSMAAGFLAKTRRRERGERAVGEASADNLNILSPARCRRAHLVGSCD